MPATEIHLALPCPAPNFARRFCRDFELIDFAGTVNTTSTAANPFPWTDRFITRHIGPNADETRAMLKLAGFDSLDALADAAVPKQIRLSKPLNLPAAQTESEALRELKSIASQNQVFRSFIGQGYYDCITPPVIQRNVFENPGWYTQYTPYQAEISQGRLEALLNFQTMASELTALDIANASMLDDPRPDTRWWALHALAEIPDSRVPPRLAAALEDPDLSVRQCAALALRRQPAPEAVPA